MGIEGAEASGERFVLLPVEEPIGGEEDDLVLQQRLLQLVPKGVAQRVTQVNAFDLRPDGGLKGVNDDVPVLRDCGLYCHAHRASLLMPSVVVFLRIDFVD